METPPEEELKVEADPLSREKELEFWLESENPREVITAISLCAPRNLMNLTK